MASVKVRAWAIKTDLSLPWSSKGVNQIEWKTQSGQTFFAFSPRDSQNTIMINYCTDPSFGFLDKVADCSLLGEQAAVPYNFVDPERTSMVFSWTLTIDENGHSLISEKGELLYRRIDGGKLLRGGPSMTVDVTFYASKTVYIDEFERGTCAPTPVTINVTVSGFTQATVCDPNIKFSSQDLRLGCVYTSEGTPGSASSDCQIESFCRDCKDEKEARDKGFGVVCPWSTKGLQKPDEKATLRLDAEVPVSIIEFKESQIKYTEAIAELGGFANQPVVPESVKVLWTKEREHDTASMKELETTAEAGKHVSTIVGFEVRTTARMIDETWAHLSEDSINKVLVSRNLAPMVTYAAETPTNKNATTLAAIIAIPIVCVFLICACCCCFKGTSSKGTSSSGIEAPAAPYTDAGSDYDVWSKLGWNEIPAAFQEQWVILGYRQDMWDQKTSKAAVEDMSWRQMNFGQQAAATTVGYTEYMWDNGKVPAVMPNS